MATIINALLSLEEPAIRYKAHVYLLGEGATASDVQHLQADIRACARVRQLLSERDADARTDAPVERLLTWRWPRHVRPSPLTPPHALP